MVSLDTHHDGLLAEELNRPLGFQLCNSGGGAHLSMPVATGRRLN